MRLLEYLTAQGWQSCFVEVGPPQSLQVGIRHPHSWARAIQSGTA